MLEKINIAPKLKKPNQTNNIYKKIPIKTINRCDRKRLGAVNFTINWILMQRN